MNPYNHRPPRRPAPRSLYVGVRPAHRDRWAQIWDTLGCFVLGALYLLAAVVSLVIVAVIAVVFIILLAIFWNG